jgi:hypothetical protein
LNAVSMNELNSNIRRKLMRYMKNKRLIAIVVLLTIAGLAPAFTPAAQADDNRVPDLPSPVCDSIQVEPGNEVISHVYARGVQIYRWNGASWDFVGPVAMLFADAQYNGQVGIHYATPNGPAWESNSGSKVIAARAAGCSPDTTAIAWLLLKAVATTGPGIFSSVTFIQRVNTTGGLAPTSHNAQINEVIEVPYTTEYIFYRAQ